MRGDIKDLIEFISKEDMPMYNKAELARVTAVIQEPLTGILRSSQVSLSQKYIPVSIILNLMITRI